MFSTFRNAALAAVMAGFALTSPAHAAPCTQAGFNTYLAGGVNATCTVLNKTISGMTVVGGDTSLSGILPLTTPNNPGLEFLGATSIPTTIMFTITAPSSDPITDASLAIVPFDVFLPQVTESLTNGKSLTASRSSPTASISFASTTSLTVTDTITSGAVLQITNQFSETPVTGAPEPSSLALLGVGLSAFALARRRTRRT